MPTYEYEIIGSGERFECVQSMHDAPLATHPDSGAPVRRVIFAPNLGLKHTEGRSKNLLDNRNIEKAGFTKYEKDKVTGKYNRVAGKQGPSVIEP
jgi:putative FmdB family regulatory protein